MTRFLLSSDDAVDTVFSMPNAAALSFRPAIGAQFSPGVDTVSSYDGSRQRDDRRSSPADGGDGQHRPGEKVHEILESEVEGYRTVKRSEKHQTDDMPDAMLLLGETNSVLTALLPKPASVPVFHMEVGNCCYDDRVPWERIFVTGNFIFGVLTHNAARIEKSDVHARLGLRLASTFS